MNNIMNNLEGHLEALLFLKGEPMSVRQLAKILAVNEKEVNEAADSLSKNLAGRGIRLVRKEDALILATAPESSEFTKKLIDEEFNSELSKASLEILSIVVYKGPVSRPEIDYIRGVNSTFTLRNLLIRGLVERMVNPKDSRSYLYKPSFQLLQFLGIEKIEILPEYNTFREKIEDFVLDKEKENF